MNRLLFNLGAVVIMLFALNIQAQNTPAPCDPANIITSDIQYGCYNTPDCVTGWMCFFIRVETDAFYGTTCDERPMYLCGFPNVPNVAQRATSKILAALLPDSLRLLHDKAWGLHGFTGSKTIACRVRGKA